VVDLRAAGLLFMSVLLLGLSSKRIRDLLVCVSLLLHSLMCLESDSVDCAEGNQGDDQQSLHGQV